MAVALLRPGILLALLALLPGLEGARMEDAAKRISRSPPRFELHDHKIVSHRTCRHNDATATAT